jgi:acyl carrier protein
MLCFELANFNELWSELMSIVANEEILTKVKKVIANYAELGDQVESLAIDEDLFAKGMSSRASVGVMLGLESEFDIEFPDAMLRRDVFESMLSISNAIESLKASS